MQYIVQSGHRSGPIARNAGALVIGVSLILGLSPALAGPKLDACAAQAAEPFEAGFADIGRLTADINVDRAIRLCREAVQAEPNSIQAKAWLGRAYWAQGDTESALPLFEEATAAGNYLAATLLGDMLIIADGVAEDQVRGAQLLRLAAEGGYAVGQNSYGISFEYGEGVERNPVEASRWYRRAAEQGLPRAQSNIGLMYQNATGVDRDYVAAFAWFEKAVEGGNSAGMVNLGKMYQDGLGMPVDYKLAAEYYTSAADMGNVFGLNNLGYLYEEGFGVEQDIELAASFYMQAADQIGRAHV